MFQIDKFTSLVTKANPTFARLTDSALGPLLKELATVKNGPIVGAQADRVQELVHVIPGQKLAKYKDALAYLETESGRNVIVCGKPVNPRMEFDHFSAGEYLYNAVDSKGAQILCSDYKGHRALYSFHHIFNLKFDSSTGNLADLRRTGTREHVRFRTVPGGPPFNANISDTPQEFHSGVNLEGANMPGSDDHMTKPPSLVCQFPPVTGELVADQWYQYTINRGATWKNIPGAAYNIIKGVRQSAGKWVFYFIKRSWAPHNAKPFKFEAEYDLLPPLPPAAPGAKLNKAFSGPQTSLTTFGRLLSSK